MILKSFSFTPLRWRVLLCCLLSTPDKNWRSVNVLAVCPLSFALCLVYRPQLPWIRLHIGSSVNHQVLMLACFGNTSHTALNRSWNLDDVYFHISLHISSLCSLSHRVQFPSFPISLPLQTVYLLLLVASLAGISLFAHGLMLLYIMLFISCTVLASLYITCDSINVFMV